MTTTESTPFILSLGSNLGDRAANLRLGLRFLAERVHLDAVSRTVETEAWGPIEQPDFLNVVVRGHGASDPHVLLALAHEAELEAGRTRGPRFGPRTLDVDIVFFGDVVLDTPALTLPHPRWEERSFVRDLLPEVGAGMRDPLTGRRLADLAEAAMTTEVGD